MPFSIIALSIFTLGAGLAFGISEQRKMKKQLPDDREIVPGETARRKNRDAAEA